MERVVWREIGGWALSVDQLVPECTARLGTLFESMVSAGTVSMKRSPCPREQTVDWRAVERVRAIV